MPQIALLSQETIDKIAAGEVIERPSSVVKELVENSIDAGATAITVEIKEGGISLIRVTDNGCGIAPEQVPLAFLRHSTSKIQKVEDLLSVTSLGFRGEALSSIAAVSRVEIITKTCDRLMGTRYLIEGSKEMANEEVGAPDGTTFLVKDLFYNTPARRKFLKTAHTEGTYVADLVEKLALSHPDISFKFINNGQTKLHTSGNGNTKDLIYHIFGREITASLLPVEVSCEYFSVTGFIGKPVITRGNRNFENYFINQRYIKSTLLAKAIEEAYKNFIMQHQYPFTVLYFCFDSQLLDVNVHPTKMELRFEHNQEIYKCLVDALYQILSEKELIPQVPVTEEKKKPIGRKYQEAIPEPFEKRRLNDIRSSVASDSPYSIQYPQHSRRLGNGVSEDTHVYKASSQKPSGDIQNLPKGHAPDRQEVSGHPVSQEQDQPKASGSNASREQDLPEASGSNASREQDLPEASGSNASQERDTENAPANNGSTKPHTQPEVIAEDYGFGRQENYEEITLASLSPDFLSQEARTSHRIIGQLFDTYWMVEYKDQLYIIDQHAAHEKVLYEQTMARLSEKEFTSQMISPPIILSLDNHEIGMLEKHRAQIERLGYVVEHFGGKEYMISAIPDNLFHMDMKDLFIEMLDDFSNLSGRETPQLILEKVASMSCKAAVKGNNKLSLPEVDALITELLSLENPYNCPHGRPTIITMTKYEIEKKFKRIV